MGNQSDVAHLSYPETQLAREKKALGSQGAEG